MHVSPINHAVSLEMKDICRNCKTHLCDFLFENKDLMVTRCGHVFDRVCIEQMALAAKAKGVLPACFCKKEISKVELLCHNLRDKCRHRSSVHDAFPAGITESFHMRLQLLITNCGHLIHAVCWLDILEKEAGVSKLGHCPSCNGLITDVKRFGIYPASFEKIITEDTEAILKDFVRSGSPALDARPKPPPADSILDGFEFM